MRRGVLFKTKRIELEWGSLYPPMRDRLVLLADYINREFAKPMTITCLTRSIEENAKVGGKPDSLHTANPCRAADIRTRTWVDGKPQQLYTTEQAMQILMFWRGGGAKFGGQEEKDHIHLQVKR